MRIVCIIIQAKGVDGMGKEAFEHLLGFHGAPLLVGVNIGGLGTPIASLASLITLGKYRQTGGKTAPYILKFLLINSTDSFLHGRDKFFLQASDNSIHPASNEPFFH